MPAYWFQTWKHKRATTAGWQVKKISYGPHRRQYALKIDKLANPAHVEDKVAVYFHGGAWTFGSPEQFLPAADIFLKAGYSVIMPSYRRLPLHNFVDIYADMEAMRDCLLAGNRVEVVAGMSAGGHLAASIGWRPDYWKAADLSQPEKMILCGAVIDFDQMNLAAGLRLLAGKPGSEAYRFANPAYQFEQAKSLPKHHLFVHGPEDGTVSFTQAHCFYDSHKKDHPGFEKIWVENGTHLDSCRWMYKQDAVAERISAFLRK